MVSVSDRKRNACLCADRAVAGRVDEIVHFNMKLPLATLLHAAQCRDAPSVQLHLVDLCVEQERQIFLALHRVQKRLVPEDRVRIGIAVEVLELQLAPHAHFLRPEIARAGRAARPNANLTARVPAQNRSVRHQRGLYAVLRRRDRRADARRAAIMIRARILSSPTHWNTSASTIKAASPSPRWPSSAIAAIPTSAASSSGALALISTSTSTRYAWSSPKVRSVSPMRALRRSPPPSASETRITFPASSRRSSASHQPSSASGSIRIMANACF